MSILKLFNLMIFVSILCSCVSSNTKTLSSNPRRIGDRPILVSDLIVTNNLSVSNNLEVKNGIDVNGTLSLSPNNVYDFILKIGELESGFKDIDGDIAYYKDGKQIFNIVENGIEFIGNNQNISYINFIGSQANQSREESRDNLGLGTIATENQDEYLSTTSPKFIGQLEGTNNASIILYPQDAEDFQLTGLFTLIDGLNIPGLVISTGEYSWAAMTVDIDNDPYKDSNAEIFNSLARIKNSNGDKAIIWDEENDGTSSGLDADLVRGSTPIRILETAPSSITDAGQDGQIAIKEHAGSSYLVYFKNNKWYWVQMNTTAFPWQ